MRAGCPLYNLSVSLRSPAPLVGEPLAEGFFFDNIACGSKMRTCRKAKAYVSRANRSEASNPENATVCQGLAY